jgi:hypothetical protein
MDFVQLTPEQRRAMDEDGFLVVRAALDRATVARAREAVDRLAQAFLNKPVVLDSASGRATPGHEHSSPFDSDHRQTARESESAGFSPRMASRYSNCSRPGACRVAEGRH